MAIGKDTALRLMLVDDQMNEAEAIVSTLRNAGIAVRPLRPETIEDLVSQLSSQTVDLVLAEYASKTMPFNDVAAAVRGCGRDVPLLAVLDGITDDILESVQGQGAQAVALRSRPQQLIKNVRTEWHDVDARRSQRYLEAQLRETERRCDMLIDSSREPIAYIHEGLHIRANPAYLEMFGYESFEDVEGMSLLDMVAPADARQFKELLRGLSKGEPPPPRYELTAINAEGEEFPAVMEFSAAQYEGEHCQQVIFRRQERSLDPALAQELEKLKRQDQVTGLLNRPTFIAELDAAIVGVAEKGQRHGLLLIEPDHYAKLIESIGLEDADNLMVALARRLTDALKDAPDAVGARMGEHQLAVLVRNSDHVATDALARKILAAFADHVLEVDEHSLNATVSIGGVLIGEKNASASQVLGRANQNLASSLAVGGNHLDIFDPGAVDRAEEERIAAWVSRIREALSSDGFRLEFQPVIAPASESSEEMYEVFLRMQGSDGATVESSAFLPIAEQHGLLGELDRWVVGKSVALIGERLQKGRRTSLLVSLSQDALQDAALPGFIKSQLAAAGVPGELLVLAVAESKVFTNLRAAQEFAATANGFGARIALERFGAGLNSLQMLAHIKPAFVKIDPQFLADYAKSADSQERVRAIASEAHNHGIQSIAEGVQDAGSMAMLFGTVEYMQGSFLAQAGPDMNYDFNS